MFPDPPHFSRLAQDPGPSEHSFRSLGHLPGVSPVLVFASLLETCLSSLPHSLIKVTGVSPPGVPTSPHSISDFHSYLVRAEPLRFCVLAIWGWIVLGGRKHGVEGSGPVYCGMLSTIPGLCSLDATSPFQIIIT